MAGGMKENEVGVVLEREEEVDRAGPARGSDIMSVTDMQNGGVSDSWLCEILESENLGLLESSEVEETFEIPSYDLPLSKETLLWFMTPLSIGMRFWGSPEKNALLFQDLLNPSIPH